MYRVNQQQQPMPEEFTCQYSIEHEGFMATTNINKGTDKDMPIMSCKDATWNGTSVYSGTFAAAMPGIVLETTGLGVKGIVRAMILRCADGYVFKPVYDDEDDEVPCRVEQ
jgi:hypothetical protein